jgi:glycosyltransferase involved in cell wall biosynthesis
VVTTAFDGKPLGRALAEQEGAGSSILFLSRLVRENGIYELLEAFAGLVSRYPDSELVLAGDGPELMAVTRRVAELGLEGRVSFPGYVRGPRKYRLLTGARVFVLPSYTEGLPVSLLEAMGAGAAVVASDTGGIGEVVSVPRNGLLLDRVTPESIAAALDRLLADDAYANQVSEANREQAWRLYEGEVVARVLERNYRAIVEART